MIQEIDKHNLDRELTRHAVLLEQETDNLAQANKDFNAAENELKRMKGQVAVDLRQASVEGTGPKVSEAKILEMIGVDEDVIAARQDIVDKGYERDLAWGRKEAMQSRGHMIRDMCQLQIAGYYVSDSVRDAEELNETSRVNKGEKKLKKRKVKQD